MLTDTRPDYLARLRERFAQCTNVSVARLYLPELDGELTTQRFDTIVCLNVLEHVEDDLGGLRVMRTLSYNFV